MKKVIIGATIGFAILTAVFFVLYLKYNTDLFITLAITFGTILYNFVMRLTVEFTVPHRYRYTDKFFREKPYAKI